MGQIKNIKLHIVTDIKLNKTNKVRSTHLNIKMATAAAGETTQDIAVKCSSEYEDYTSVDTHDIWSLVSLTAPCRSEDEEKEEKVPMDIVAVMDKSGSMAGAKLELVKKTLEFVLTQLTDKDRLALITYDTQVYADFGLMKMTKGNKQKASQKIQNISDGTCTNLCGGLLRGLCEIMNRPSGGKNDVASVLLFTDGLANEGIQNVDGIVQAMKDPRRFCGATAPPTHRDEPTEPAPHTSWLKNVFGGGSPRGSPKGSLKSGKKKAASPAKEKPDPENSVNDATVYTFGFGEDHDANMLKSISDAGNGMYYFIETEDKIGESFAHCLGGLASTVAQGIQLAVKVNDGVTIKEVHTTRAYEETDPGKSIKVNIGDLQAGDRARRGSWEGTQDVLNERIGNMRLAKETAKASNMYDSDLSDEYDAMIDDLEDYSRNTKYETEWKARGKHQEMNMEQEYVCQRSNAAESKAFQTKSKSKAVKSFKLF